MAEFTPEKCKQIALARLDVVHKWLEFRKKSQNKLPDSIWETYSAFANTDGGTIILGLEEKNNHYSPVDIDVDKIKKELKELQKEYIQIMN